MAGTAKPRHCVSVIGSRKLMPTPYAFTLHSFHRKPGDTAITQPETPCLSACQGGAVRNRQPISYQLASQLVVGPTT